MILIIDNYDSFVFNLGRYFEIQGEKTLIFRNDNISLNDIERLQPSHIVISPGPRAPKDAGISIQAIRFFAKKIPILGVCLGHQAIAAAFGAEITRAHEPMHGKSSDIHHSGKDIFSGITSPMVAGRYHSLIVSRENLPKELIILASSARHEIMAIRHETLPIFGVQFHPESILTEQGMRIIKNFIQIRRMAIGSA